MRWRNDSGLSLTELLVVLALMGFVLALTYMSIDFGYRSQEVAEAQSQYARDVNYPLQAMDHSFSQRVAVSGFVMNANTATIRLPSTYTTGFPQEHTFTANTDGTLTQQIHTVNGATRTLVRTVILSRTNANRSSNTALFAYYNGSATATNAAIIDNVRITVVSNRGSATFRDTRRVYFRNQ
ncbi:MAG: prepilin-type N-terminal cleavage/methylation domain-containing protein [Coriobacteriia bacterium]|nr:prepilin-type N-terminal cleavage/methylation domain-containing protein [Coriobacteriia bacterium]